MLALPTAAEAHSLTYAGAKSAARRAGNASAGTVVRVERVVKQSFAPGHAHEYEAEISWSQVDPTGCENCVEADDGGLEDGPITEECTQYLRLRFRSPRSDSIVVSPERRTCLEVLDD